MAPRFDDSRWFHPGGYPPPPRVPLSLVALALSLRRATGSVHAPVARGKRSAPENQCVGGAIEARELTSDKMTKQGP